MRTGGNGCITWRNILYNAVMVIVTLGIAFITITGTLKLYGIATGYGNSKLVTLFGYKPMIVVSGSMLPSIQINSLNLCKETTYDDLEVGDVLVYRAKDGVYITHRVRELTQIGGKKVIIAKGDNNAVDDPPVYSEQVVGEIVFTWNGIAPLLSDIIPEHGKFDAIAIIRCIVVIVLCMLCIQYIAQYTAYFIRLLILGKVNKIRYHDRLVKCNEQLGNLQAIIDTEIRSLGDIEYKGIKGNLVLDSKVRCLKEIIKITSEDNIKRLDKH